MCEDRPRSGAFCRVCDDLCGLQRSAERMSADTYEDGDEVNWLLVPMDFTDMLFSLR